MVAPAISLQSAHDPGPDDAALELRKGASDLEHVPTGRRRSVDCLCANSTTALAPSGRPRLPSSLTWPAVTRTNRSLDRYRTCHWHDLLSQMRSEAGGINLGPRWRLRCLRLCVLGVRCRDQKPKTYGSKDARYVDLLRMTETIQVHRGDDITSAGAQPATGWLPRCQTVMRLARSHRANRVARDG